jgi:putative ABC transport system permease protein
MFKNYFKIAVRQLRKQKMYSAIKIGGFALSIAACLLIALYIRDELSYDKSYPDADRIYRVVGVYDDNGTIEKGTSMPAPFGKVLKADYPEVVISGRLMSNTLFPGAGDNYLRRADQEQDSYEKGFSYADQEILDLLQIPMVYGDRAHALSEPNTLVISKKNPTNIFQVTIRWGKS